MPLAVLKPGFLRSGLKGFGIGLFWALGSGCGGYQMDKIVDDGGSYVHHRHMSNLQTSNPEH